MYTKQNKHNPRRIKCTLASQLDTLRFILADTCNLKSIVMLNRADSAKLNIHLYNDQVL
jgi:hypothetical protein